MAPLELVGELVEEILLRVPPDDPARLVRAALVCRQWCRLVSRPGFRRRFRARHRRPPLLGFIRNLRVDGGVNVARLVPATLFCSPRADRRGVRALDARHGRVLLHTMPWALDSDGIHEHLLFVWDPITDEQRELPTLPLLPHPLKWNWSAAVLCAAGDGCDHLGCHRGPVLVVFVVTVNSEMFVYVYSSVDDAWTRSNAQQHWQFRSADQYPCGEFALLPM